MLRGLVKTLLITSILSYSSYASESDDVTSEVFGDDIIDMFPIAIGDYDSDKLMDTVFLSNNSNSFEIYFGFPTPPFLRPKTGFHCDLNHIGASSSPVKIVGLSLADFTGDGVLDILVTINDEPYVRSYVFRGNLERLECNRSALKLNGTSTFLRLKQEPLVVDGNGDMIADLFGEPAEERARRLWIFRIGQTEPVKSLKLECDHSDCLPMPKPHSNAFADLTGDFSPELIVVSLNSTDHPTHHLELFSITDINNNEPHFSKYLDLEIRVGELVPALIGSLIIMDIDQTGRVVPCIPYCSDLMCKNSGLLVLEDNKFKNLNIQFSDHSGKTWGFIVPDSQMPYAEAISLRFGDFDLDGFPDLIGTLAEVGSKQNTRSVLFFNVPCKEKNCTRTFSIDFDILSKYNNSVNAVFYDIYDNGLLDVVLLEKFRTVSNVSHALETSYKVQVVLNTPKYDGYFLKWMMTSGLCVGDYCPPYGAVLPGASMNYSMMDQKGNPQVSKAAQFFRSSYFAMDLPFVVVGTGSSPNFIDTVWIGKSPSQHLCLVQKWRQIIPNSHLVVIPYSNKWELKHFLTTNKKGAISTLQALVFILCINGIIVFLFWFKEKKEDRRNVQMSGSLNFIRLS